MGQKFIDKARAIVLKNLSNDIFGVGELASELGLSKSQTLRKVKAVTGKSVNQFIRELRLEKAAKLIKKTDDSIAEISYKVGFSSPSYFNKTFSKYYGIAPGEYKTKSASLSELQVTKTDTKKSDSFSNNKLVYALSAVLLFVIGYFVITIILPKNDSFANSIAVLPFKDLSPEDTQWFSDGVSDNILHSLAQMSDVSVTSFTSSATYRKTDKQIPEIAKELGVSYILEGSVTLVNDEIKIIAQLIDANDQHVWSKEYKDNFDNVIAIQNNVAREVMQHLKNTLNPKEQAVLKKYPTNNMEAYDLHLRGHSRNLHWHKPSLENGIEMNKKAIALDSSFSGAYSSVAQSYFLLSNYHFETVDIFDCRDKANYYADMALQADSENDLAWNVKGLLSYYVDWEQGKKYIDKALALNPNGDHIALSIYYNRGPSYNPKKELEVLRVAYELNPLDIRPVIRLFYCLIANNRITEAEEHLEKNRFLANYDEFTLYRFDQAIIAYKNKDYASVITLSKSKVEANPKDPRYYLRLAEEYDEILNDDKSALTYAKQAYVLDSRYVEFYVNLLIEDEQFEEANSLMQSTNYKSVVGKRNQLNQLWYYYYNQKNYPKALNVLKDSLYTDHYLRHTYTYAQMGNRKKVDSMNKRFPWGTGRMDDWFRHRASIHAALKDRDSMYFYLEDMRLWFQEPLHLNGHKEVDPYRNEDRFKAFLRMNYLPVPGE
jgi:TolB-like protein/AraC-like DNA-binding protein